MKISLRNRLVWILLALTLFAWLTSAGITYYFANRALLQQVDRQLEQYAILVAYVTGVFARQLNDDGKPLYESWSDHDYDQAHLDPIIIEGPDSGGAMAAVNIWENGHLIATTDSAAVFAMPEGVGFESLDRDDGLSHWRVFSYYSEQDALWIRVGIELGAARQSMQQTLGSSLLPLFIVLPVTIVLLYLGVSRGLQPLRELALQISQRKPGLLDPVDTRSIPAEVSGVVGALNDLLQRLADALEGEQRFTANAAHELLTPLAAIKTEVQLCQRQLQSESGAAMLGRIVLRVDRASHSVEQLLTLARLDPDLPPVRDPVNLRDLLTSVLIESGHLAADRGVAVVLEEGSAVEVAGAEEALAILLRNLVNNAFRYASEDSSVDISLTCNGAVTLAIANDCEPMSAGEFERITERFYRVPGSAGLGAGLGLSIVGRIVELHDASLKVTPGPDGRGFRAEVVFPQPA